MELSSELESELVEAARKARLSAYAPYSGFAVGAAVLGASGRIYAGCNVENAAYGATLCAERVAVGQAVAAGERRIAAACVVTESEELTPPCGACRQVLAEFGPQMVVVIDNGHARARFSLQDLLPHAFTPDLLPRRTSPSGSGRAGTGLLKGEK